MPSFGFSAFLKLLSLNDRPQRREIRSRLLPRVGGYDFHKSLRVLARRYLVDGETLEELQEFIDAIARAPERRSAQAGLEALERWRAEFSGEVIRFSNARFDSPNGVFRVNFVPDFGLDIGGVPTAIHVWNTAFPPLSRRMTYMALALIADGFERGGVPADVGVLSLRDGHLYRLSDVSDQRGVAHRLADAIEEIFREIREELELPPARPEDRPRV